MVRRTREIGIRMALGARKADILRLVMREGFLLTVAGSIIGLAGAFGLVQSLRTFFAALSDITRTTLTDPWIVAGAPLLLFVLTLAACLVPAARSTAIDPMRAIREE